MIPANINALLLGEEAGAGAGYQVSRSLRFNSADSSYLSRTPASAGNRKTWTWAGWVKRSALGTDYIFTTTDAGSSNAGYIWFANDVLAYWDTRNASDGNILLTNALFRDLSAWYHIVLAVDYSAATPADRAKFYVNGVAQTYSATNYPLTTEQSYFNSTTAHYMAGGGERIDGYLADIHFIDGQALTPSSFAETNATTGQWVPKAYTGTYGTNGFRLDFSDNSAATATTLGKDQAGSNNWTPNNLSVTAGAGNDSFVDTPTSYGTDTGAGGEVRGNYCTWGAAYAGAAGLSNGNLDFLSPSTMSAFGSISFTTGKWYWEILNSGTGLSYVGIMDSTITSATDTSWSTQARAYVSGGSKYDGSSTSYGASWAANDVIGFALDLDANTLTFFKNGTSQGVAFSSGLIGKEWKPFVYGSSGSGCSANFGQRPFAYTAPSGFKALCDTNLPAPTIARPSTVMDVKLYTGNGGTQTISGLNFSPDLVWIKERNAAADHALYDIVRGTQNRLESNTTDAAATSDNGLTAFNSDGFALGSLAQVNTNADTYVAWAWDAGSTTVTNTQGSITSSVRANASAGFSIVTYTGNNTGGATVGHGLSVKPALIIVKSRSVDGWAVRHDSLANNQYLFLNSTGAAATSLNLWFNTAPTSAVFSVNSDSNVNGASTNYVAYCFAPVAGLSSYGTYQGNGSADGPMVFANMRPRWIMLKRTDTTSNWTIIDTAREGYNVDNDPLYPNLADAEGTADLADILSNGFKLRSTDASVNASAGTYVYAAFAESPFAYSRAR
jgi:hypothetical protein